MKKFLRHLVVNTITLYLVTGFIKGLVFEQGVVTLLLAGAGLTVASILAKPIINLLLLPLNMVTFNLFKWISSAIALYLVTLVVPGFKVAAFIFDGFSSNWLDIPSVNVVGIFAFVLFSLVISLITTVIYKIIN